MLTAFQKAALATIAGSAVMLALVLAAMRPAGAGTLATFTAPALTVAGYGGIAPGVITTGSATVKVKPDIAILGVGATAQAASAAVAQAQVAARVDRILLAAKALGIADRDVKTSGYQITPTYAQDGGCCGTPRISGYQAIQMLSITLRKVDEAGKTLDALVRNDGATNAGIAFTLEDPKAAQAEARRLAVEDAKAKAEALARTAGVSLGKAISISDQSAPTPYSFKGAAPLAAPATADSRLPVGDLDIVVSVQVQFAIQ